ncbi:MAG TPA: EamA family transporter [Holophagaceae bacterium]|jgi:drug/metabolite transporter (DMT)-like permease|nr:EamA family transporter [Holophagaceae bacterium]
MLAWLAYATIALVWGSTYFAIALGLESYTAYGLVAWRFTIGAALALVLGRVLREPLPEQRDLPHLALVGVLLLAGSNALVSWAETRVSTGIAAILCALVPVGLAFFDKERLDLRAWSGLGLGLLGLAVLTDPLSGTVDLEGVGALLLAVALWSFGTIHGKRHIRKGGLMTQVGLEMLAAAVVAHLAAPLAGGHQHAALTTKALLAMLYLAVFGSVIAFTAYMYLAKAWTPAKMGTYAYLNPIVAVVLGCAWLKEPFNGCMVLGMLIVLASVALVQLRPSPKPETATETA